MDEERVPQSNTSEYPETSCDDIPAKQPCEDEAEDESTAFLNAYENADENEAAAPVKEKRKFNFRKAGKLLLDGAGLFIMVLGVFIVLHFIWGAARGEFHSDSTDTLYWAEAAMQGNGLINPDFSYAALMPFGGNILMQIWIPFFGVSMTTHSLGMTTFLVLFAASLYWLLHEMKWSIRWKGIAIGGLLMAVSLSTKLREIFWGHIIYYSLGMLFLIAGLAMVLHIYNLQERQNVRCIKVQKIVCPVLLFVMFTIFCTNSTMAIALFALPVTAALFCERFLDHTVPLKSKKTVMWAVMFIICLIGIFAGIKLGSSIAGGVTASYANAYSHFTEPETWREHIDNLPLEFLKLNGLEVNTDSYLMSIEGIGIIMLIAYIAVIVILPFAALFCYGRIKDTGLRMLIWSHFVVSAFILIGYICGMLNTAKWRLSPIIVTGFLLSIAFMRWIYKSTEMKRLGILLLIPAAYVCTVGAMDMMRLPKDSYLEDDKYKLAQYFEEQGLEYGYASFWNAHAITVQSDSKCKVRNVDITEDGVIKRLYQSNVKWYEEQEGQDDYFLLMNYTEHNNIMVSGSPLIDKPHTELEYLGYFIWVFDDNIF